MILVVVILVVVGLIRLWRTPELRFLAIAATLVIVYVLVWIPGKPYYTDGMAPVVLAAGSAMCVGRRDRPGRWRAVRHGLLIAAPLVGLVLVLPILLPFVPQGDVRHLPSSAQQSSQVGDEIVPQQLPRRHIDARE